VIIHDEPLADWVPRDTPAAVTIGVLDGVHRGHRALIDRLNEGLVPTVLTFDPHPVEVFRPGTPPRLITTVSERIRLFESAGVDQVGILDLQEIKDLEPAAFVIDVLVQKLKVGKVVVGPDFRFGKDRTGNTEVLRGMGVDLGFEVEEIEFVGDHDAVMASSRIRELIESGDVSAAADALGSRFTVTNVVVAGDRRGREIGFPTANISPPDRKVVPGMGVYAAFVSVSGEAHQAAVNVGVRPTFGGGALIIEAFILDFDDEIYGEDLTIEFVEYLRPELKFDGVDQLITAMNEDVARCRRIFAI
jgi:riboflavin kinase / FMN adenylyltransferase